MSALSRNRARCAIGISASSLDRCELLAPGQSWRRRKVRGWLWQPKVDGDPYRAFGVDLWGALRYRSDVVRVGACRRFPFEVRRLFFMRIWRRPWCRGVYLRNRRRLRRFKIRAFGAVVGARAHLDSSSVLAPCFAARAEPADLRTRGRYDVTRPLTPNDSRSQAKAGSVSINIFRGPGLRHGIPPGTIQFLTVRTDIWTIPQNCFTVWIGGNPDWGMTAASELRLVVAVGGFGLKVALTYGLCPWLWFLRVWRRFFRQEVA